MSIAYAYDPSMNAIDVLRGTEALLIFFWNKIVTKSAS